MLQRLFHRNAPSSRVEDAVDHGKILAERDALRERSAVILERLERKKVEARRAAVEKRQAAEEAAERARREAQEAAAAEQARAQEAAEAEALAAAEEQAEMTSAVAAPAVEDEMAAQEMPEAVDAVATESVRYQAYDEEEPAMAVAAAGGGRATAMRGGGSTHGGYFTESEPLRAEGPAEPMMAADTGHAMRESMSADDGRGAEASHAGHADHEAHDDGHDDNAGHMQAAHPHNDLLDDPEVLEQIRKKAEEAKARIAARLEKMEAGQGHASAGHVDLGEDAPPLAPDHGDED